MMPSDFSQRNFLTPSVGDHTSVLHAAADSGSREVFESVLAALEKKLAPNEVYAMYMVESCRKRMFTSMEPRWLLRKVSVVNGQATLAEVLRYSMLSQRRKSLSGSH